MEKDKKKEIQSFNQSEEKSYTQHLDELPTAKIGKILVELSQVEISKYYKIISFNDLVTQPVPPANIGKEKPRDKRKRVLSMIQSYKKIMDDSDKKT